MPDIWLQVLLAVLSYGLTAATVLLLTRLTPYPERRWMAWVPIANWYQLCRLADAAEREGLAKTYLVSFLCCMGCLILAMLASGSLLANILLLVAGIALLISFIVQFMAIHSLAAQTFPHAKYFVMGIIGIQVLVAIFPVLTPLSLAQPLFLLWVAIRLARAYRLDETRAAEAAAQEEKLNQEQETRG